LLLRHEEDYKTILQGIGHETEMTDSIASSFGGPCAHSNKLPGSVHAAESFLLGRSLGIFTGFTPFF